MALAIKLTKTKPTQTGHYLCVDKDDTPQLINIRVDLFTSELLAKTEDGHTIKLSDTKDLLWSEEIIVLKNP